jgi:uncharacterized protein YraI
MRLLAHLLVIVVACGLVLGPSAASAAPGHALANVNIRSGPGTGYAVVGRLDAGDYVVVLRCVARWCAIHHIGPDGWVARSQLVNPYYSTRPYYQFAPKHPAPGRAAPGR